MPRIKVFTAMLGFYETAVAARSQKMALAHWGVARDLFRDGTAKETNDPQAVQAAMRKVGLVVRRPIGSGGAFEERADAAHTLLKTLSDAAGKPSATKRERKQESTPRLKATPERAAKRRRPPQSGTGSAKKRATQRAFKRKTRRR